MQRGRDDRRPDQPPLGCNVQQSGYPEHAPSRQEDRHNSNLLRYKMHIKHKNNIQNIYFLLLGQTPLEMANAFETPNQEIIEALKVFG